MEIGSHTVSHPVLTQISRSEVERELAASRNTIAEEVGQVPSLFCYPHGSFTEDIKQQTARYYGAAVSTMAGGNTPATDPLELRRIAAYNVEDLAFEMARPR
jgi:peptidoglycan/xylan/chitin deacetylase (PgdA/CDA1 family)